jgi:nitrate/nitrite transporter NarK
MSLSRSKALILSVATLGFGVMDLMLPAAWALCLDVGRRHAGVVTALMNTAGQFSGFVCAISFGYVVKATGSYSAPLWIVSAMILVSAGLFALIDPTRPLVRQEELDSHLASKP